MKRLIYLIALMFIIAGCAEDIVVAPPGQLRGVYEGTYTIVYKETGSTTTEWQYVDWTFTDLKYFMEASKTDLRPPITCDISGNYILDSKILFTDTSVVPGTCKSESYIAGEFAFITISPGGDAPDTLRFFYTSDTIEKTIKLVRIADIE